jgi:uncharacterized ferritin-like protein (DUF455 family)
MAKRMVKALQHAIALCKVDSKTDLFSEEVVTAQPDNNTAATSPSQQQPPTPQPEQAMKPIPPPGRVEGWRHAP